ncbi:class III lanthionine synthetase LanKC [Longispora urticae]
MRLNWQVLAPYCLADEDFYEAPDQVADFGDLFPQTMAPPPAGWRRHERGWWIVLRPLGALLPAQGWKIHVSARAEDAEQVCQVVWEHCVSAGLAFKFLRSHRVSRFMNGKHVDRGISGKLITIYPADECQMERAVKALAAELEGVEGPYVLSDLRIGAGPVHVRYGSFTDRSFLGEDGEPVPAIATPDGQLVPDSRRPVFTVPEWVTVPEFLEEHRAAQQAVSEADFPFQIEAVLHFSNGGGVYRARDERDGRRVVLLEARPHAGLDADGLDAVARLYRQREILSVLSETGFVPECLGIFQAWEHHYLVLEHIEGNPLTEEIHARYPLAHHPGGPTAQQLASYTTWATSVVGQLRSAVAEIHERGLFYGDIHPHNLIVRPDGRLALIDFEFAGAARDKRRSRVAAPGFMPPEGVDGLDADEYQMSAVELYLLMPMNLRRVRAPAQVGHVIAGAQQIFPVDGDFGARLGVGFRSEGPTPFDPADPLVASAEPDWPAIRASLIAGIEASATPSRFDRLFPGDPSQYASGPFTLAYGAAGVLYTLGTCGGNVRQEHVDWLVQASLRAKAARPGFYDGLHGVAYALDALGDTANALNVLDRAMALDASGLPVGLVGGRAGMGLNLVHFAEVTGDGTLMESAARTADGLMSVPTRGTGLLRGMTGAAMLYLRLAEATGDTSFLDHAATALRCDLDRGEMMANGTFQLVERGARTRYLIYLDGGSGGLAMVLDWYLRHRDDERMRAVVDAVRVACRATFVREPGLFRGRMGLMATLVQLGRPEDRAVIDGHIRRLAWHAQPYAGHLAFPGRKLRRLSMDLATGSAGILLALNAVFSGKGSVLPHLPPLDRGCTIPTMNERR